MTIPLNHPKLQPIFDRMTDRLAATADEIATEFNCSADEAVMLTAVNAVVSAQGACQVHDIDFAAIISLSNRAAQQAGKKGN